MLILVAGLLGFMFLPFLVLAAPLLAWFIVPLAALLGGVHVVRVVKKRHHLVATV